MPEPAIDPPFNCRRCGLDIGKHVIFHDEPPPDHGLTEGVFARPTTGYYCPPAIPDCPHPECRAKRWNGTPAYDGPHDWHFFTYGPNGMYTGSCSGR